MQPRLDVGENSRNERKIAYSFVRDSLTKRSFRYGPAALASILDASCAPRLTGLSGMDAETGLNASLLAGAQLR